MKQKRAAAKVELASVPRTVTLLGATGSIGSSTPDLLRGDLARYPTQGVPTDPHPPAPPAMVEPAQRPADWVMAAITGAASLAPTLAAAERGATVALANKECLVCAGALFMRRAAAKGATVLPVDSEHNAIFQALGAGPREDVRRIVLTASGGPFRTWSLESLRKVPTEQARS